MYEQNDFIPILKNTQCCTVNSFKTAWSAYSCVRAVLRLIEAAIKDGCDRLILLQGADLPLKNTNQIDDYFSAHISDNYIPLFPFQQGMCNYMANGKHYFLENPHYRYNKILKAMSHIIAHASMLNTKNDIELWKGSALISITKEFGQYLLEEERYIEKRFKYAQAADEIVFPTMIANSPFRDTWVYELSRDVRLIDFVRTEGNSPHCMTMNDLPLLKTYIQERPEKLFSRKFMETIDMDIVKCVEEMVKGDV